MDLLSDDVLVKHVLPCLTFREALLLSRTSKRYSSLVLSSKELWKGYYYSTFSSCGARNEEECAERESTVPSEGTANEWLLACKEELAQSKSYRVKLLAVQKLRTRQEIHAVERKIYFCGKELQEERERVKRLQKSSRVLGNVLHENMFAEAHKLWQPMAVSSSTSRKEVVQVGMNLEEAKCNMDADVKLSKLEVKKMLNRLSVLQNRLNELKHRLETLQG